MIGGINLREPPVNPIKWHESRVCCFQGVITGMNLSDTEHMYLLFINICLLKCVQHKLDIAGTATEMQLLLF